MPNKHVEELIQSLKQEMDDLAEQQSRCVRWAVYDGMSRNESAAYDNRQKRISDLARELKELQESGSRRPENTWWSTLNRSATGT